MAGAGAKRLALALLGVTFLTACEDGSKFKLFDKPLFQKNNSETGAISSETGMQIIESDVEAPEVFAQVDTGLWDGRPSLGGVWVAHPDVVDPERVIIRNEDTGSFVIGALFRRERDNPGPRFQVSSEAAVSLGLLAGAPANLNVVALRRQEIPVAAEVIETATGESAIASAAEIEETSLDPVASMAASAIATATATQAPTATAAALPSASAATPVAAPSAAPAPKLKSSLEKPFIQIGIFSIETNANNTADLLRKDGVIPIVKKSTANSKEYWRVIVGPASNESVRKSLLAKVKTLGFPDAYAVTN